MCVLLYKVVLGWWLHFKFRLSRSRKRDEVATSCSAAVQGAHLHCHVVRVVARVFGKHKYKHKVQIQQVGSALMLAQQ